MHHMITFDVCYQNPLERLCMHHMNTFDLYYRNPLESLFHWKGSQVSIGEAHKHLTCYAGLCMLILTYYIMEGCACTECSHIPYVAFWRPVHAMHVSIYASISGCRVQMFAMSVSADTWRDWFCQFSIE